MRIFFIFPTVLLLAAVSAWLPGCRTGRTPQNKEFSFNADRPEWIRDQGRSGMPEPMLSQQITAIRASENLVLFGVRNAGLAVYHADTDSWTFLPVDPTPMNDELLILDAQFFQGDYILFADGIGIMRCPAPDGPCAPVPGLTGRGPFRNITRMAAAGGNLWAATRMGLYTIVPATGRATLVTPGCYHTLSTWKKQVWTLSGHDTPPLIQAFNPRTGAIEYSRIASHDQEPLYTNGPFYGTDQGLALPATNGFSLYDQDTAHFTHIGHPQGFPDFIPTRVLRHNGLWILATDAGLVLADLAAGQWELLGTDQGLPASRVLIAVSAHGRLWLGAMNGALQINDDMLAQMRHLAAHPPDGEQELPSVQELARDVTTWKHLTVEHGLINNSIYSLLAADGLVWIGTGTPGLNSLDPDTMAVRAYKPGPEINAPTTSRASRLPIMELAAQGDRIWIGGYAFTGIFDKALGQWENPPVGMELKFGGNAEALWSGAGQVWLGVRKYGLIVLDTATGELTQYPGDHFTVSAYTTDIVETSGALWVSSDMGLRRFSPKNKGFAYVDIANIVDVESMSGDGNYLWIGCRERNLPPGPLNTGLYRYDVRTRHLVALNTGKGAELTHVNKVLADGPDVWVAARQGLGRYDRLSDQWTIYSARADFGASDVLSVAVAAEWLVVGTDNGLFVKPMLDLNSPDLMKGYARAWAEARSGNHLQAAESFLALAEATGAATADHLLFRAARNLELAGEPAKALEIYGRLKPGNPGLDLEMESAMASVHGFHAWVDMLAGLPSGFMSSWLDHAAAPLEFEAHNANKHGDFKLEAACRESMRRLAP